MRCFATIGLLGLCLLSSCQEKDPWEGDSRVPKTISYNRDVRPILARDCLSCHRGTDAKAGLCLDLPSGIASVTQEDSPKKSLLWEKIQNNHPHALAELDQAIIWRWIRQGAASEGHWAARAIPSAPRAPKGSLPLNGKVTTEELAKLTQALFERAPTEREIAYIEEHNPDRGFLFEGMMRHDDFIETTSRRLLSLTGAKPLERDSALGAYYRWLDTQVKEADFSLKQFLEDSLAGDLKPDGGQQSSLGTAWLRHPQKDEIGDLSSRVAESLLALDLKRDCFSDDLWPSAKEVLPEFLKSQPPALAGEAVVPPFLPIHTPRNLTILEKADPMESEAWTAVREISQTLSPDEFQAWIKSEPSPVIPDLTSYFAFDQAAPQDSAVTSLPTQATGVLSNPSQLNSGVQGTALAAPAQWARLPLSSAHPFTLAFFLRIENLPNQAQDILLPEGEEGPSGLRLTLSPEGITFSLQKTSPDNALIIHSPTLIEAKRWYHLALTYDGSRTAEGLGIWLDAFQLDSDPLKDDLYGIAGRADGSSLRLMAQPEIESLSIDELQVYRDALSTLEIMHLRDGQSLLNELREEFPREDLLYHYYLRSCSSQSRELRHKAQKLSTGIAFHQDQATLVPIAKKTPLPSIRPALPFHTLPSNAQADRLGFAQWLLSPKHPVTPRVLAARIYKLVYQIDLLPSADISDPWIIPSQPELLDFLARDLVKNDFQLRPFLITVLCHPPTEEPPITPSEISG